MEFNAWDMSYNTSDLVLSFGTKEKNTRNNVIWHITLSVILHYFLYYDLLLQLLTDTVIILLLFSKKCRLNRFWFLVYEL